MQVNMEMRPQKVFCSFVKFKNLNLNLRWSKISSSSSPIDWLRAMLLIHKNKQARRKNVTIWVGQKCTQISFILILAVTPYNLCVFWLQFGANILFLLLKPIEVTPGFNLKMLKSLSSVNGLFLGFFFTLVKRDHNTC